MEIADGFERQRLSVLPRPLVEQALNRPVTRRMLVTDAGYFPVARHHGRHRPTGARETIVIVCGSGSGWVEIDGARTRVTRGTALIIPGGTPHAYGADNDSPWTIWWCHVRGTDVAELVEAAGIRPGARTLGLRAPERVTAVLDEIAVSLSRDTTPARIVAASGLAWNLFTLLAADRVLPHEGTPLERAMRYLEERVDSQVQVPELAALVGVSPSHLAALFRDATGGGVLAHHNGLKMARARTLLDTTDMTVAEIARAVGRDDPFYFSRQFSRTHGMSPRAYREMRKG
ncbi:AraC family transcriptional regulator [Microbacterium halophytorum]|uniref:AraC family transcriptional regulator n=1 Tax=Microbacterium halophytorum TaxID=2067568 RepID=UPI000CFD285C|nr:AraC family transcriptional regulator [Microbacterium halophytorum]